MQISAGTVTVTNGDARVIGNASALWGDLQVALGNGSPVFFMLGVDDTAQPRAVASVESPATSLSGFWELSLVYPWDGGTQAGVKYKIHKDFTPLLNLAIPTPGDRGWAQLEAHNVEILDGNSLLGSPSFSTNAYVSARINVGSKRTMVVCPELVIPPNTEYVIASDGCIVIL